MTRELLVSATPFGLRAAAIEAGRPCELHVESTLRPSRVGDVVLGRVGRVAPAQGGAFVELPERVEGWLETSRRLAPGETLLVQVLSDARGRKGPRLGAAPALAGVRLVFRPGAKDHAISRRIDNVAERTRLGEILAGLSQNNGAFTARSAAAAAPDSELRAEAEILRTQWQELLPEAESSGAPRHVFDAGGLLGRLVRDHGAGGAKVICDDPATSARLGDLCGTLGVRDDVHVASVDDADLLERHDAASLFEAALQARVAFAGGCLTIEETEALVAIDVDLFGAAPAEASLRALEEAGRAIRLRNLAGLIVIDLPRLKGRGLAARQRLTIEAAFAGDHAQVEFYGQSAAGLIELNRQRRGESVRDALTERPGADGARAPRLDALAFDLADRARRAVRRGRRRLVIRAAPSLVSLFAPGPHLPNGLDGWLGAAVTLRPEPERAAAAFEIDA